MIYRYKCTQEDCGATTELVQPITADLPDTIACGYCPGTSTLKIEAPAVLTQGMATQKFDVAVGKDADRRWKSIHERQAARDRVRKETNTVGLAATGYTEFKPISPAQKQVRTNVTDAAGRDGYRSEF